MGSDSNRVKNFVCSLKLKDLDLNELKPLVSEWVSREPDSFQRASLEDKFSRLLPERRHVVGGLLYHLYAESGKLPEFCHFGSDTNINEKPFQNIIQEALPLYHRMVQVKVAS